MLTWENSTTQRYPEVLLPDEKTQFEIQMERHTGSMREDSIANQLVEIEKQPWYAGQHEFLEAQKTELESDVRWPDPNYLSIMEGNLVMQSLETRKSPGPDSVSYENWRQLDPELAPFMVKAFSETITWGDFDPEWFRSYVKPLPKKPGKLEVRPILP